MTNKNLKPVLSMFIKRIWNEGDFACIEDYVAPTYEIKSDPGDPWEGQHINYEDFQERVLYSRNAFPDLRFEIQEMIEGNEQVAASWIMSGTHIGDLPQLPGSGRSFSITGITLYYFEDGKVCGHWQAYDRLGFLTQMGYLKK